MKPFLKIKLFLLLSLLTSKTAFASNSVKIDSGTTAWMLISTTLVLLMIPGLAMFYGGLVKKKNVLGTMFHSYAAMGIMGLCWVIFGYSFSFGNSILGGFVGWNWDYFMLKGIDTSIINNIPEYVFAMFQGKFAIIAPALIAGAFAERVKFKSYCIFIVLWSVFVYNPLCHWVWYSNGNEHGFLYAMGAIDFAGGTVVHISSGISGLVVALLIKKRKGHPQMSPNNLSMTLIGAGLLWVGWFGFNAGSSISSGLKTAQALTMTQIAAASGSVTWIIIESLHQKHTTSIGFASGILAGLVAITPAAGDVLPYGALILGVISSIACYIAIQLKNKMGYDDTLDVFGIHGVGAIFGAIFLVFFMREGDILKQFYVQVTAVSIALFYSAAVTFVLIIIIEKTVGFRLDEESEIEGLDYSQHRERAYSIT